MLESQLVGTGFYIPVSQSHPVILSVILSSKVPVITPINSLKLLSVKAAVCRIWVEESKTLMETPLRPSCSLSLRSSATEKCQATVIDRQHRFPRTNHGKDSLFGQKQARNRLKSK